MPKVMIYIEPKVEEYNTHIYIYDDEGRLTTKTYYKGLKQIVIRTPEVRVSRQLFYDKIALIIDAKNPKVELRGEGLLYIVDGALG